MPSKGRVLNQLKIGDLQEYALQDQDPQFPVVVPRDMLDIMKPLTSEATALAAVQLLKHLGVWAPHLHLAPVKAGLTSDFGSNVLVSWT